MTSDFFTQNAFQAVSLPNILWKAPKHILEKNSFKYASADFTIVLAFFQYI